eukprot:PLAT550.2.p1 GENE.PLAT550.2~~PLAT550.2.p1  ORF type:complete len:607 (+),score=240.72 PLAT550.2:22-1842(+)
MWPVFLIALWAAISPLPAALNGTATMGDMPSGARPPGTGGEQMPPPAGGGHGATSLSGFARDGTPRLKLWGGSRHDFTRALQLKLPDRSEAVALLVDTTTMLSSVPCSGCQHCISPALQPKPGSHQACHSAACDLTPGALCTNGTQCGYLDVSSGRRGSLVSTSISIGEAAPRQAVGRSTTALLGCDRVSGSTVAQSTYGGVLGLATSLPGTTPHLSVIRALSQAAAADRAAVGDSGRFSLCIGSGGGMIGLGGWLLAQHCSPSFVVPTTVRRGRYYLHPQRLLLGKLGDTGATATELCGQSGCLLDSSSSSSFIAAAGWRKLVDSFLLACPVKPIDAADGSTGHLCFPAAAQTALQAECPPLRWIMTADAMLGSPSRPLLTANGNYPRALCLPVARASASRSPTLGADFLVGYDVLFDPQSPQLQFAVADCGDEGSSMFCNSVAPREVASAASPGSHPLSAILGGIAGGCVLAVFLFGRCSGAMSGNKPHHRLPGDDSYAPSLELNRIETVDSSDSEFEDDDARKHDSAERGCAGGGSGAASSVGGGSAAGIGLAADGDEQSLRSCGVAAVAAAAAAAASISNVKGRPSSRSVGSPSVDALLAGV